MSITHLSDTQPSALCSLLVPSCDAYSDLWQPFFTQFWSNWPDCPFPVYLGSNQEVYAHPRVIALNAGHGNNWTNRVREQILMLDTPYVLLILEDFFLRTPVPTSKLLACFQALQELNGEVVRLIPQPGPDKRIPDHPLIGEIVPGVPYRVSTQAAIWRRETLLALMRDSESIWQFEVDGSPRSESYASGFYGVWEPILTYGHHVVERGKWFRKEAATFGSMGIGCDFTRRPVMSRAEMARWYVRKHRGKLLNLLPPGMRERIVQQRKQERPGKTPVA